MSGAHERHDNATVAKMYVWRDRLAYLATKPIPLRDFTVDTDQLIVCLSGCMHFYADPAHKQQPDQYSPAISSRSILIRAGTKVDASQVDASDAVLAICYLNTIGYDHAMLSRAMRVEFEGVHYQHRNEQALIDQLREVRDQHAAAETAYHVIDGLIASNASSSDTQCRIDPRIISVIDLIKSTKRKNLPVEELARRVHLSESRLTKLFRSQVGVPISRYRLSYRVFVGYVYLALGYSVTDAAHAAGFSSTAHFSKCFTASIGIQPSARLMKPPFVEVIIDEEIVQEIAETRCQ